MSALVARRPWRVVAGTVLMVALIAGCSTGGHPSSPTTQVAPPTTSSPTSSTAPGPQTSGSRTVLNPTGLNVRGAPSVSAPVVGSAAQGTVLTVLGYTASGGGWFKVKGATVTGWITAQPSLSAPGEFHTYSSSAFSALYPADWSESALGPASAPTTSTSSPDTTVS
ncbi:MAG TPA: SH3 domain-containing protein, partial [Acidimicrobiales bacterium]|nr:SH3 domain-containing protein [Acidimicrobiales bacterium]